MIARSNWPESRPTFSTVALTLGSYRVLAIPRLGSASSCFGSYRSPERDELVTLVAGLPRSEATQKLQKMGFTTVLFHHPGPMAKFRNRQLLEKMRLEENPGLRLLLSTETLSAYEVGG